MCWSQNCLRPQKRRGTERGRSRTEQIRSDQGKHMHSCHKKQLIHLTWMGAVQRLRSRPLLAVVRGPDDSVGRSYAQGFTPFFGRITVLLAACPPLWASSFPRFHSLCFSDPNYARGERGIMCESCSEVCIVQYKEQRSTDSDPLQLYLISLPLVTCIQYRTVHTCTWIAILSLVQSELSRLFIDEARFLPLRVEWRWHGCCFFGGTPKHALSDLGQYSCT